MKTLRDSKVRRGFTLMELMVAMAITTIIVTVLVSITSIALDTWNRSRSELRASRQAKSMIDTIARDFEGLVARRGNTFEWLSVIAESQKIGNKLESTNASKVIFFSAATDRYSGQVGHPTFDKGGDVSCVAYQLEYKDPITGDVGSPFKTFVFNRLLVNPNDTFSDLLGSPDLVVAFNKAPSSPTAGSSLPYSEQLFLPENFVCENVFQYSITFQMQVTRTPTGGGATTIVNVPITIREGTNKKFSIYGNKVDAEPPTGVSVTKDELASARLVAMEVSVTIISDFGIDQSRTRTFADDAAKSKFFAQNSYQYSKLVQLPTM